MAEPAGKTAPEQITLATRQQIMLDRLKSAEVAKFKPFLQQAERDLQMRLIAADIETYDAKRIQILLDAIERDMRAIFGGYTTQLTGDLIDAAVYQAQLEARNLQTVSKVPFESVIPSPEQVRTAVMTAPLAVQGYRQGALLEPWLQGWTDDSIAYVNGVIQQGYYQGKNTAEIVRSLRGTSKMRGQDGTLAQIDRANTVLVRTAVQHSAQVARETFFRANDDIVLGLEWVAALDSRTTIQCFPGETAVSSIGALKKIFRAKYVGEMVVITTASGKKLKGTPNHPILTPNGFLPLGELKPSQHVVYSVFPDCVSIDSAQDISVPSSIAELFDFASKQSGFDVVRKSPSAVDFYGDGVGVNGEIDVVSVDGELWRHAESGSSQGIIDELLGSVKDSGFLSGLSGFSKNLVSRSPSVKAAKGAVCRSHGAVDEGLASSCGFGDFSGPHTGIMHLSNTLPVPENIRIGFPSAKDGHDPSLLQQACDGGRGGSVFPSDGCGAGSGFVFEDDIVSVERELAGSHFVYSLETCTGIYIAGGITVKNCRSLDGKRFPLDSGPRPPLHPQCRSTTIAVLDPAFDMLDEGATRASKGADGGEQVPASLNYYEWLKTQPSEFQDVALGPARGELFRKGGLSAERFAELNLGKNFEPLTLEQMKELEPVAFARAGL